MAQGVSPAGLVLDLRPHPTTAVTFEDGVDDAGRTVAILEGSERRSSFLYGADNHTVHVAHHVAEGVGPCLLMPARQMRVRTRRGAEQRRILEQRPVRGVAPSDPQLVLVLLPPPERRAASADLEPQIVLVTGADLADREG